jgi:hypothetical protein
MAVLSFLRFIKKLIIVIQKLIKFSVIIKLKNLILIKALKKEFNFGGFNLL